MAPSRKSKPRNLSSSLPFSPSSPFIPAVSTVAVAQICLSVGYTSAEPAALRSLTAVATLYLQTLARSAASIANAKGRTQSNLLDLTSAIEDLALPQGFAGAFDPTRPLLKSSVLKDLRSFVRRVREIPFPKPIGRREEGLGVRSSPAAASFAQAGRETPGAHVPRWLPCFPEKFQVEEERRERGEERRRWEEKGGIFKVEKEIEEEEGRDNKVVCSEGEWVPSFTGGWEKKKKKKKKKRELGAIVERERVKFELLGRENRKKTKKRLPSLFAGEERNETPGN